MTFSTEIIIILSITNFITIAIMLAYKNLWEKEMDNVIAIQKNYMDCIHDYSNIIADMNKKRNNNSRFLSDDQITSINLALKIAANKRNNQNTAGYEKIMNARMIMENYLETKKD